MTKILFVTLLLVTFSSAQKTVIEHSETTTKIRIETKLKELGFCCNSKTISKVESFAKETTTDRELEDVILKYI